MGRSAASNSICAALQRSFSHPTLHTQPPRGFGYTPPPSTSPLHKKEEQKKRSPACPGVPRLGRVAALIEPPGARRLLGPTWLELNEWALQFDVAHPTLLRQRQLCKLKTHQRNDECCGPDDLLKFSLLLPGPTCPRLPVSQAFCQTSLIAHYEQHVHQARGGRWLQR